MVEGSWAGSPSFPELACLNFRSRVPALHSSTDQAARSSASTGRAVYLYHKVVAPRSPAQNQIAGCSLHACRHSLAAVAFPSPPLEERGRERRPTARLDVAVRADIPAGSCTV